MRLLSPGDFEVFQRASATGGPVLIEGEAAMDDGHHPRLEWRWTDAESDNPAWQRMDADWSGHQFTFRPVLPAGGWYRIEVRVSSGGGINAPSAIVEHVGVGEVFLVAGQSNSANHGEARLETATGRVSAFDADRAVWQPCRDPQPGASGSGGSFMPPLGDALVEALDVPVGFIACGIGATSVREWLPAGYTFPNPPTIESRVRRTAAGVWESDGDAFGNLMSLLKTAGPDGIRAVLWHQGESDANQRDPSRTLPGELYRQYLTVIISESRRIAGWEIPWMVAQVSYHVPGDEASPDIRAAQASLWAGGVARKGPDTDALKGALRESGGQGVHFSRAGLKAHARAWADCLLPWIQQ